MNLSNLHQMSPFPLRGDPSVSINCLFVGYSLSDCSFLFSVPNLFWTGFVVECIILKESQLSSCCFGSFFDQLSDDNKPSGFLPTVCLVIGF